MGFWRGMWLVCWAPSLVALLYVVGFLCLWGPMDAGGAMVLVYSTMTVWAACFMVLPPWHRITDKPPEGD